MNTEVAFPAKGPIEFDVPDPLVTPAFRELLFTTYEGLKDEQNQTSALRMMAYILYGTFLDKGSPKSERRLVASQEVVAVIEGKDSIAFYSSGHFLKWFDKNVLPLHIGEDNYWAHRARTIAPQISREIRKKLRDEPISEDGKVTLFTGEPRVISRVKTAREELEAKQREIMALTTKGHPARPLIDYLLADPQKSQSAFKKILRSNKQSLLDYVESLPMRKDEEEFGWGTKKGRTTRVIERIFTDYGDVLKIYYKTSLKTPTPRISAIGLHIHSLPREARKIALIGSYECDLRACQLAVVAKLWGIQELDGILRDETSNFWTNLLDEIGMSHVDKPTVKRAIYSTIFGMSKKNVYNILNEEDWFDDDYVENFKKLSIIKRIFKRRKQKMLEINELGGYTDAFGNFQSISTNGMTRGERYRSLASSLACQAQSYELKIMLSIMDILDKEEQIYLLLWLHDGVYLALHKESKKQQWINRLTNAVEKTAQELGIPTTLDFKLIKPNDVSK